MSSNVLGRRVAKIGLSYEGTKTGDKRHKELVSTFNSVHPSGQIAHTSDYWCAIFQTAIWIMAGLTMDDVPMDYNVENMITKAKHLGIWEERDSYVPRVGDSIVYNWKDSGKGDCTSGASHVGNVYKVTKTQIYVIEGNAGDKGVCKRRVVNINGITIRGFICPDYNAIYIDYVARRFAYPLGTDKKKYSVKGGKPNFYARRSWRKRFKNRKYGSGCHQYVMHVMKVCGYKTMPLIWDKIPVYLRQRCALVKDGTHRKGDINVYCRTDSKGKHWHIGITVYVSGKLMLAEANQGRYYPHINKSLAKFTPSSSKKVWTYRPKER